VFPPVTGAYVFELTSDDQAVVYLSTDHTPAAKKRIAGRGGATGWDDWTEDAKSKPIHLEAGKAYYIEALQKEGGGEDHLRVGWKRPDDRLERPIPGTHLAPPPQPASADATAPSP